MSKNIVIFADGTGQEGGLGNNTNVYDLFNMIEDRTRRQVSYYDRGLGTGWSKVGAVSGVGITRNILETYQFISDNYAADDRIYLFGFSRGATTVRTLSAFIHLFGVLPRSRPELVKRAWRIYKIRNQDRRRRLANEFVRRNHTMWARVRFLGVWDTVAALGLPLKAIDMAVDWLPFWNHSFHDLTLARSVEVARHALAIDDERSVFHPQLWDEAGEDDRTFSENEAQPIEIDDIGDIYLVAEKLKAADHPVTKRLELRDRTRRLLNDFDPSGKRQESPEKVEALTSAVVADFNMVIYDNDASLYDPRCREEYEGIALSSETRARLARFQQTRRSHLHRIDRLLVEDAYSLRPARKPRVKQVWFAGMHTDVGGGYRENELSHIPLVWMLMEAIDSGLLIYDKHQVDLDPDERGRMHDSRAGMGRFYRRRVRRWDRDKNQGRSPLVHESVALRSRCDYPLYEPWILKTKYDLEPWPARMAGSIQYDDHHIWRESFWGWGGAFAMPWSAVERIACDEQQRTITFHMKGQRKDIVVKGGLPKALSSLVAELERQREHKRLEEEGQRLRTQDERLEEQDRRLEELLSELRGKVAALEQHIRVDDAQTAKLQQRDKELTANDKTLIEQNRKLGRELDDLRAQLATLEQGVAQSRAASRGHN